MSELNETDYGDNIMISHVATVVRNFKLYFKMIRLTTFGF